MQNYISEYFLQIKQNHILKTDVHATIVRRFKLFKLMNCLDHFPLCEHFYFQWWSKTLKLWSFWTSIYAYADIGHSQFKTKISREDVCVFISRHISNSCRLFTLQVLFYFNIWHRWTRTKFFSKNVSEKIGKFFDLRTSHSAWNLTLS